MRFDITHDERTSLAVNREEAEALGYPEEVIAAAEAATEKKGETRQIRARIEATAGDTLSLLGTASDGAALTLVGLARLAKGLSEATTMAEVNAAAQPFASLTASFLAAIEDGSLVLPAILKTEEAVLAEVATRAAAVTAALTANEGGENA